MDYVQIKSIVEEAVKNAGQFKWWLYLLILVIAASGSFLGSYLKKKAENLATKEDIEDITKKIEEIRSGYNAQIEFLKASLQLSNQLKLAALDKRLQKHQEAYSLWRKLLFSLNHKEKIIPAIIECENWWDENCLYLGHEARSACKKAIFEAVIFKDLAEGEPIRKSQNIVEDAGKKIVDGVNLIYLGKEGKEPSEYEIVNYTMDPTLGPI